MIIFLTQMSWLWKILVQVLVNVAAALFFKKVKNFRIKVIRLIPEFIKEVWTSLFGCSPLKMVIFVLEKTPPVYFICAWKDSIRLGHFDGIRRLQNTYFISFYAIFFFGGLGFTLLRLVLKADITWDLM